MGNLIKLGIAKIGLVKQKGLVLSVGLVKKIVEYDYYQWLFARKSTDIKESEFDVNNYGTGGIDADVKSFNQVLTSDGSLVITFDTAPTIDDYNGTAAPTVNGNTIEVGAGQLFDITVNGELFPLIETKGTDIWGVLETKATLSTDIGVWDNLNEDAINWLYILGGELYVNDITPTDKIRVIKGTNGFIAPTITGYTPTEQHNANAGVWDSGSEYLNQDNVGLNTVFDAYAGLADLKYPSKWDFDTVKRIQLGDQKLKTSTQFNNLTQIINDYSFDAEYNLTKQDLSAYDNLFITLSGQSNANLEIITDLSGVPTELQPYLDKVFIRDYNDSNFKTPTEKLTSNNGLRNGPLALCLKLAQLTGKNVYLAHAAWGGTGYSTTPSWNYGESGGYAEVWINTYLAARADLPANTYKLRVFYNQWEADGTTQVDADNWLSGVVALKAGFESETGDLLPWTMFKPHQWSTQPFKDVIAQYMQELLQDRNNVDFFGNESQLIGLNQFIVNGSHYLGQYYDIYSNAAAMALNLPISDNRIQLLNTKSLSPNGQMTSNNDNYNIGAKSIWSKMKVSQNANVRLFYDNSGAVNGIRARFSSNSSGVSWLVYESGVKIIDIDSIGGTKFDVPAVFIFSWDGTTDENAVNTYHHYYDNEDYVVNNKGTAIGTETSSPANPVLSIGDVDIEMYSRYELDRALTQAEIDLIVADRDEEITGVVATYFDTGYGTSIYAQNGQEITASGAVWGNNGLIPYINKIANREIQTDGANYRVVPQGTIEAGWTFVENIDINKWYDFDGSSIKLPQIPQLVDIDTSNIFYDANGIAKEVTGVELRAANETYLTIESDDISITSIKIADIIILAADYSQTVSPDGTEIYDIAVEPYEKEPLFDNEGSLLLDENGEKLYPLKDFS